MLVERIVSGGQTGADRAALDWALANDVPHGGWCPAGRRAEDGAIDARYGLREMAGRGYLARTEKNVIDSDATVIFSIAGTLTGGSKATREFAKRRGRPWRHLSREGDDDPALELRRFVRENFVRVLNVAGPRASSEPEIASFVLEVMDEALRSDDEDENA